jgi:acetylornithine deacetylase
MSVVETLRDLVAIDSVSVRSNVEIISYLESRLAPRGFKLTRFPHVDETGAEKINLVAQTQAAAKPQTDSCETVELALVGHTDTVPYDPNWTEALRLTERDAKLFGRGACDTKAFIAATLTAIEETELEQLKKPLALVFTSDEEIGCLGAKRLAESRPLTVRYAIVGEPTSLQPMRAGKGYSLAEVTVRGREAHSAYPQIGSSAIFRASRLITRIAEISAELQSEQHPGFDPPFTSVNVGLIKGGSAKNIIPGECRFTLEWRTIPGQASEDFLNRLKQAVAALQEQDKEFSCEIDAARADRSFEVAAESPLVQFLEATSGKSSGAVAFGTEAPSMIALGADAIVFGPGDIRVAHRTGEFVPVNELADCVRILREAIQRFCGNR